MILLIIIKKNTPISHNPYGPAQVYLKGKTKIYYLNGIFISYNGSTFFKDLKEYLILNSNEKENNISNKIDVLNIKNCLLDGLDSNVINTLKSLL